MEKWNKTRFQVMEMIQGNVSVKEIAALLHLSEQAVYKTVRAGALEVIISLFQEIEKVLDQTVRDEK